MVDFQKVQADVTAVVNRADLRYDSAVINHYTTSENLDGEDVKVFNNQEPIIGIILDYQDYKKKYDIAGNYENSSYIFLVDATTVVDPELDTISIYSKEYRIEGIKVPIGGNYKIIQRLFLKEDTESPIA